MSFRKEEAFGIWLAMIDSIFRTIYKEFIIILDNCGYHRLVDFEIKH